MMRRVVLWLTILILLLMFCTSAAIAYGQGQPYQSPLPALGYDLCDGVPCYLGLIPGYTTWVTANERIAGFRQDDANYDPLKMTRFIIQNVSGFLISNTPDLTLSEVALTPLRRTAEFPTLLDVLLFYGTPCNVYTEEVLGYVTLIRLNYPHLSVDLSRVTDRLTLDRHPEYINFKRVQDDQCLQTEDVQPWRGLAIYQHYLRH